MTRLKRAALITTLADKLCDHGSWCGETHLQKAVYFLQELLRVPTGFEFVLYKRGPFSFDLRDDLAAMRADGLLDVEPRPAPYGPTLTTTPRGAKLQGLYPKTLARYLGALESVAEALGGKGAAELERLATALWIRTTQPALEGVGARASHLRELKPHVTPADAVAAVAAVDEIIATSPGATVSVA